MNLHHYLRLSKFAIDLLYINFRCNDSIFSSSKDATDLSRFDDFIQDNSTNYDTLANEMLDDSSNVFLPGLTVTQDMDNKQPESTYTLPTSSIVVLANPQPAYPLDVKFRVIEDSVKTEFVQLTFKSQYLSARSLHQQFHGKYLYT